MITVDIRQGHVLEVIKGIPDGSVHCAITSPPYFGLRDYGTEPVVWGGDADACEHEWGEEIKTHKGGKQKDEQPSQRQGRDFSAQNAVRDQTNGQFCHLCGAWRGCLGLEPTMELYVQHLVEIFRGVRRVLRDDGTFFLVIGDCYAGSGKAGSDPEYQKRHTQFGAVERKERLGVPLKAEGIGLKNRDLCGVPWRVAFALQADGWYLRQDNIWFKPNPMPESVDGWRWERHRVKADGDYAECPGCKVCEANDGLVLRKGSGRTTTAHEYVFHFNKSGNGFWDREAVKEKPQSYHRKGGTACYTADGFVTHGIGSKTFHQMSNGGRNLRSVWEIATTPFPEAHFAVFPVALVEKCIKAGTSEKGACPKCGAPLVRVVEDLDLRHWKDKRNKRVKWYFGQNHGRNDGGGSFVNDKQTLGWRPSCKCGLDTTAPATVLDPFGGSGTVGLVAAKMGRNAILIEAKPEYCDMARKRIFDSIRFKIQTGQVTIKDFIIPRKRAFILDFCEVADALFAGKKVDY